MARRPTTWEDTIIARDLPSGTQQLNGLVLGLSAQDQRQATVIRTIISLWLHSTTVAGAWGAQRIDLAIGMISLDAFTAGESPDPNVAQERPPRGWLWRTSVMVSQNGTGTDIVVPVMADIRGARKLENSAFYIVGNSTARSGTPFTTRWDGLIRCLLKL